MYFVSYLASVFLYRPLPLRVLNWIPRYFPTAFNIVRILADTILYLSWIICNVMDKLFCRRKETLECINNYRIAVKNSIIHNVI